MGKRFKNKLCVYCTRNAAEGVDHVLCRKFVLEEQRRGLPEVPACNACNGDKAQLEHYLTAVLPTGIPADDLAMRHIPFVQRRLAKNQKLWRELDAQTMKVPRLGAFGTVHLEDALLLNGSTLLNLYRYMVRGLTWHHWKCLIPSDASSTGYFCNRSPDPAFTKLLELPGQYKVSDTLADGALAYEGVMVDDNPAFGAWRFSLLYGATMRGESGSPEDEATHAMVIVVSADHRQIA